MAELTQEEKLILNSFVYIDMDLQQYDGWKLADVVREMEAKGGWGNETLNEKQCEDVFRAIENSSSLGNLEVFQKQESDYAPYSKARIMVLKNGSEPIVVFHGTEGLLETAGDISGAFEVNTLSQRNALAYINMLHDRYGFENISVTGHSNGGNKAMYAAVLSDYVTDCYAVDAQGFSPAFLTKYDRQIREKQDKITLIASEKSTVKDAWFPIAGKTIYISSDGIAEEGKLGCFSYHRPAVLYTVAEDGTVELRGETVRSDWSIFFGGFTQVLSACFSIPQTGIVFFEALVSDMSDWYARSSLLGNGIESLWQGLLSGTPDGLKGMWQRLTGAEGWGNAVDSPDALRTVENSIPLLTDILASCVAFAGMLSPLSGMSDTDGVAGTSRDIARVVTAAAAVCALIKAFEISLTALLKAGITVAKATGLAAGCALVWLGEKLVSLGRAAADGLGRVFDWLAGKGKMKTVHVKAAKEAARLGADSFSTSAGESLRGVKGAKWVYGVFSSPAAVIAHARDLDVTMSKVEEMRNWISRLRQYYGDVGNAAGRADALAGEVYCRYTESYVRRCCSDIRNDIRSARKYLGMAERELERKQRMLSAAADSYRGADRRAAGLEKGFA